MESSEIERVRGTVDVLPGAHAAQQAVLDGWRNLFSLYGYQSIDTPVLEPTDLFLRKAGEEIVAHLYSFSHWNRNLCLRPEFTASIIRAYVNHLQDRSLPVFRWAANQGRRVTDKSLKSIPRCQDRAAFVDLGIARRHLLPDRWRGGIHPAGSHCRLCLASARR